MAVVPFNNEDAAQKRQIRPQAYLRAGACTGLVTTDKTVGADKVAILYLDSNRNGGDNGY